MKRIYLLTMLLLVALMSVNAEETADTSNLYHEPYRPQYHFSPKAGWIGDPCGFMFYQGKYHAYWWGKAESTDLVHYQQITSYCMTGASKNIGYFTGSAVIDKNNTAGYGKNAFIAAYTVYEKDTKKQAQGISFSLDGRTFHYYDGNPVIDLWSTEFRDPTVFWYEPQKKWVMVVAKALEKKVKFYASSDLKHWTWMSDFGPAGDSEKSWECPDLFQLSVDGNPNNKKWVMVVSVNWSKEQYFIGDFDGTTFRLMDNHPQEPLYIDKGLDYYASRTFQDFDDTLKDKVTMGWVSTWDYAQLVPSTYGKGFWSIPRCLQLKTYKEGIRMTQNPIKQLETIRRNPISIERELPVGIHKLNGFVPKENVYELDATFHTDVSNTFGFNLCVGGGRKVSVSYDTDTHNLVIDRTHCTDAQIPKFSRMAYAKVEPLNNQLRLHIFVDKSSVEIFTNDGKDVFTLLTYPAESQTGIEVFSMRKGTRMKCHAWMMNSIWK
jgi:fructan beta-fructosidase